MILSGKDLWLPVQSLVRAQAKKDCCLNHHCVHVTLVLLCFQHAVKQASPIPGEKGT